MEQLMLLLLLLLGVQVWDSTCLRVESFEDLTNTHGMRGSRSTSCQDHSQCSAMTDICDADGSLAQLLCPHKCGFCGSDPLTTVLMSDTTTPLAASSPQTTTKSTADTTSRATTTTTNATTSTATTTPKAVTTSTAAATTPTAAMTSTAAATTSTVATTSTAAAMTSTDAAMTPTAGMTSTAAATTSTVATTSTAPAMTSTAGMTSTAAATTSTVAMTSTAAATTSTPTTTSTAATMTTTAGTTSKISTTFTTTPPTPTPACYDHITSCDQFPNVCSDSLGKILCPVYCNTCEEVTPSTATGTTATSIMNSTSTTTSSKTTPTTMGTTADTITTTTMKTTQENMTTPSPSSPTLSSSTITATNSATIKPNCPMKSTILNTLGCTDAEIVFLIEYAQSEDRGDVDDEGDYIRNLIQAWNIDTDRIRVGVVVYHDTVREVIHLADDAKDLNTRISYITRYLRPSGDADLGRALDFVRQNVFTDARSDVERIVVPIVHTMTSSEVYRIPAAAQRLRDECVTVMAITIFSDSIDYPTIHASVEQPFSSYSQEFYSFGTLDDAGDHYHLICS